MRTQADFFSEENLTADQLVIARHREVMLTTMTMLMETFGVVEATLEVHVPNAFPEYSIRLVPLSGVEIPAPLAELRKFAATGVLRSYMVTCGIRHVELHYPQERLEQLRDYMASIQQGKMVQARFDSVPIPAVVDPEAPRNAPGAKHITDPLRRPYNLPSGMRFEPQSPPDPLSEFAWAP